MTDSKVSVPFFVARSETLGEDMASEFLRLDQNLLLLVLSKLGPISLACACCCCRTLRELAAADELWKPLCKLRWHHAHKTVQPYAALPARLDSQHSWKGRYQSENGWKSPHLSFSQSRLKACGRLDSVSCLLVCDAGSVVDAGISTEQQVAVIGCSTQGSRLLEGVHVYSLPAADAPGGKFVTGTGERLLDVCSLCLLPPGSLAVGCFDTTHILAEASPSTLESVARLERARRCEVIEHL